MFNKSTVLVITEGNEDRLLLATIGRKYITVPRRYSFLAVKFTSVFVLSRYLQRLSVVNPELATRIKSIEYKQFKKEA